MKNYTQLTYEERVEIGMLLRRGMSMREIGRILGRSPNTIAREVREKRVHGHYLPKKAHHKTYFRRYRAKRNCMKVALDPWLTRAVFEKIKKGWSPERIAGWATDNGHPVSTRSVYRFVHSRCLERYLFRKKYKRKSGRKIKKSPVVHDGRCFVDTRPPTRGSGHYEADFIVSPHNTWSLLVVVDRYTRHTRIKRIPNRKHVTVSRAFESMLGEVTVTTLTLDNDISFAHWRDLETLLHTKIYFTHPYCSWEKGLVENTNRWIRLFVPKRSDIYNVTDDMLHTAHVYLNETPRQCLQFKTATEVVTSLLHKTKT